MSGLLALLVAAIVRRWAARSAAASPRRTGRTDRGSDAGAHRGAHARRRPPRPPPLRQRVPPRRRPPRRPRPHRQLPPPTPRPTAPTPAPTAPPSPAPSRQLPADADRRRGQHGHAQGGRRRRSCRSRLPPPRSLFALGVGDRLIAQHRRRRLPAGGHEASARRDVQLGRRREDRRSQHRSRDRRRQRFQQARLARAVAAARDPGPRGLRRGRRGRAPRHRSRRPGDRQAGRERRRSSPTMRADFDLVDEGDRRPAASADVLRARRDEGDLRTRPTSSFIAEMITLAGGTPITTGSTDGLQHPAREARRRPTPR